MESGENAGSFFVWEEGGKSETGMVIDCDVEGLSAGARIAVGAIACSANAWLEKAAKLFNIKMKELAWRGAFVAHNWRLRRIESSQAIEAMALEDAREGGFGDGKDHEDLSVGTALAAESQDLSFELGWSFAWLAQRPRGTIIQTLGGTGLLGALEPLADGFFTDAESCGSGAERGAASTMMLNQFSSHERSEYGISVHVVPEEWRGVASRATTILPDPQSADNVLKHDT